MFENRRQHSKAEVKFRKEIAQNSRNEIASAKKHKEFPKPQEAPGLLIQNPHSKFLPTSISRSVQNGDMNKKTFLLHSQNLFNNQTKTDVECRVEGNLIL